MYLFTSEVVSPGHPNKCTDNIVDAFIIADENAIVDSEVFVVGKYVVMCSKTNIYLSRGK